MFKVYQSNPFRTKSTLRIPEHEKISLYVFNDFSTNNFSFSLKALPYFFPSKWLTYFIIRSHSSKVCKLSIHRQAFTLWLLSQHPKTVFLSWLRYKVSQCTFFNFLSLSIFIHDKAPHSSTDLVFTSKCSLSGLPLSVCQSNLPILPAKWGSSTHLFQFVAFHHLPEFISACNGAFNGLRGVPWQPFVKYCSLYFVLASPALADWSTLLDLIPCSLCFFVWHVLYTHYLSIRSILQGYKALRNMFPVDGADA